jgi:hypothetical protein
VSTPARNVGAWHGDPELKARVVEKLKVHRAADALIQGVYQRIDPNVAAGYRGCAIGCTLDLQKSRDGFAEPRPDNDDDSWHLEVERQYGIPRNVAGLIDDIFEELDQPEHADFAVDVIEAIPVGADLDGIWDRYFATRRVDADQEAAELIRLLSEAPLYSEARTPGGDRA